MRNFRVKSWVDGGLLFEGEFESLRHAVEAAVKQQLDLSFANLWGAEFADAALAGAKLSEANFAGANLERANLEGANLSKANLAGANLIRANLRNANLENANLGAAIVRHTDFWGANTTGIDMEKTKQY